MDAAQMLSSTTLFDDLPEEDIRDLAEHLKEQRVSQGQAIFRKGEAGDSLYVVKRGVVAIYLPGGGASSSRVPLKQVSVGEYFGELALFDDKPRSATAEASTDCELLELERGALVDHMRRRPRIAIVLLAELAGRLRETNALLGERAAKDVNKELDAKATLGNRVADRVAEVAGSWAFILSFISVLVGWIIVNSVAISRALGDSEPFDPFPFIFFNLILSIVAAFQGPIIMMSQNRQSLKDRAQADTDFKVNLKNEIGIENIQRGVQEMQARISILEKSGATRAARPLEERR